jgi:hypothetical protein
MFWKRALPAVVLVAVMLFAAPTDAQQGKRANVTEVSKEVRGESEGPVGPGGMPRPDKTEDGREFYYMDAVYVTAIRDFIPARKYTLWTRMILAEDKKDAEIDEVRPLIRDALITALSDMVQIDWGGDAEIDSDIASQIAKDRVESIVGEGVVDALDFQRIEVQVF